MVGNENESESLSYPADETNEKGFKLSAYYDIFLLAKVNS